MLFGTIQQITFTIGSLDYLTATITGDDGKTYRYRCTKRFYPNFYNYIKNNFAKGDRVVYTGGFHHDETRQADYTITNFHLGRA